jgi:hypothetical protein
LATGISADRRCHRPKPEMATSSPLALLSLRLGGTLNLFYSWNPRSSTSNPQTTR